jgi:molybdenum cofactor cytidylyltransferase
MADSTMNSNGTGNNPLTCIILAAGNSSRLGTQKQFVIFRGKTLLNRTINIASFASNKITVVTGYNHRQVKDLIASSYQDNPYICDVVFNSNWQVGMGTSIAKGIDSVSDNTQAVMILLTDQYLLQTVDIERLLQQYQNNPDHIIASQYFDRKRNATVLGAPAIFPTTYFSQLSTLTNKGARNLIQDNINRVIAVSLENASNDLDTVEDLKQLQQANKKS